MKNLLLIVVLCLSFMIETVPQSFSTGKIGINLSGAGRVRVFKDSTNGVRQIDRSSILVGTSQNAVFGYNQDAQNVDPVVSIENPQLSDFEIYGSADNSWNDPPLPPNVLSKANVYGWLMEGFAVVKFTILNKETTPIDAVIGMEVIPQVNGSYGLESMKWLASEKILSIYRIGEPEHTGYKILSSGTNTVTMIDWYDGYDTVDTDLWGWMTSGTIDTLFDSGGDGSVNFISQNSVNISLGDSTTFWVGISIGDSESEMVSNMSLAEGKYNLITDVENESKNVLTDYKLNQNYPNPFNPSTAIQFSIPKTDFVSLKIYDVLGNEISELINEIVPAGEHTINFNAGSLTSGIYFYRLVTGDYFKTNKMTLIK